MILQSLAGLPAFLVHFCTALIAVVAYRFGHTRVTPHDEFQLIRDNMPSAAIALGLSLLGFVLPVVSAIAHSANVVDCPIWSAIALVVQIAVYFIANIPVMGTFAMGGGAYALMPSENCEPNRPGMAAPSGLQTRAECPPRGSSSSSSHGSSGGSSSRGNFFSGDSSSHSSSGTSSDSGSGAVTRGGFGLVCACVHVAFFRRRLTTKPPGPRPARSCETAGLALPADRKSASMLSLECRRL